jgi:hypothetical protein
MRRALAIAAIAVLLAVVSLDAGAGRGGRLCVVRTVDEGAMNANPVRVWGEVGGRARRLAELKGGQKRCVGVAPGRWSLEARSRDVAAPKPSAPEACRSSPFVLDVGERETVIVTITPLGRAPAYYCGWDLR